MSKLVTFEQATKLKELGYDEECLFYYHDGFIYGLNPNGCSEYDIEIEDLYANFNSDNILNQYPINWYGKIIDEIYSAPCISKVLEWFREVKGVECSINLYQDDSMEDCIYYVGCYKDSDVIRPVEMKITHSLAESALLDALIEYVK